MNFIMLLILYYKSFLHLKWFKINESITSLMKNKEQIIIINSILTEARFNNTLVN